jgi:two-component system chemotaxis response regulator CheY
VTPPFQGLTALVVDDSAAMRRALGRALRRVGLATVEAEHGAEAWRRLQGARADIILTDINMPVMDGLKLIGLVRGTARHDGTPIVVISTEATQADRRRASRLGAADHLMKPVRSEEVVAVVTRLLAQREVKA